MSHDCGKDASKAWTMTAATYASKGWAMTDVPVTTRKDWTSDQEVRWCPGCGDYTILATVHDSCSCRD